MHRGIAPSLIEETAILVQDFEEIEIGLRSQPVKIPHFEVRPLVKYVSQGAWNAQNSGLRSGSGCRTPRHHRSTSP